MPSAAVTSPADELDQSGADEIPDTLGIAHDARHEHACLRRIEVAHRQTHDPGLDPLAHVGNRALSRDTENLRQHEGGQRLDDGGRQHRQRDRHQQIRSALVRPRRR